MPDQFARLFVPQSFGSPHTKSSYLRLGSYYAAEESGLLPNLTTTTSKVESSSPGAEAQADEAKDNVKKDPAKEQTATSQQIDKYTNVPSKPIASSNAGILIFSDSDLNENITGAALQKIGAGHNVEVTKGDAKYSVVDGKYDLAALNGIFIKAGTVDANYDVTQPANLEIIAGGYIKQTAYGPLDETTYGETHKIFRGDAYDEFYGFKESIFHGREHQFKMSGTLSLTLSGSCILKLATEFTLTGGIDFGIRLALDCKFFIGGKFDFVIIADMKFVVGFSMKFVLGEDYKIALSDKKILSTTDMKLAPVGDIKICGNNITVCNIDLKYEFASVKGSELEVRKNNLKADLDKFVARTGMADLSLKQLKGYL